MKAALNLINRKNNISRIPTGIFLKSGRWYVNGKTFDEMYDYEKLRLSDFIIEAKG